MSHGNATPNPANGPVRPESPDSLWREVVRLCVMLVDRVSEEGLVIPLILAFKVTMELLDRGSPSVDSLTFAALGAYLTLRLLRLRTNRG